jgi:5,10-methenyltetrahydromethanopterin hydrogenase
MLANTFNVGIMVTYSVETKHMSDFEDRVRSIPDVDCDGFWCVDSEETFIRVANILVAKGIHEDDVITMLEDLYNAVANEFGS